MDPFSSRQLRVKAVRSFPLPSWILGEKVIRKVFLLVHADSSIALIVQLSNLLADGTASPAAVSGMVFGSGG